LKDVFKLTDVNKNNTVDKNELKLCLRRLGFNMDVAELDTLFNAFKGNQESLHFEEFKDLVESKFFKDIVEPGMISETLKIEISKMDLSRSGFLNRN